MEEIYIKKSNLNEWVAKYFNADLISVDDLVSIIEELDSEVEHLKEEIEDIQQEKEEDTYQAYKDNQVEKEYLERG